MSSRDWEFRVQDILKSIKKIEKYLKNLTFAQFSKNEMVIDAVVRNFEIIGEASTHLSQAFRRKHPDVPWLQMSGMRNILIHEYFGVDVKTVWHTAKTHLPSLKSKLESILEEQKSDQ